MMALPTTPRHAMNPMVPVCRSCGMISVMMRTQEGYMGPMATPTREKHTAEPMREGTNRTMNSSPMATIVLIAGQQPIFSLGGQRRELTRCRRMYDDLASC